ncbi:MAG: hypothetical protein COA79_08410 [Planctomycetota bacterium]|nr:MAG: hypothetical protein COA79_08410 [Planctomycetota bacterium]
MKTLLFCLIALILSHSEYLYCQENLPPKESPSKSKKSSKKTKYSNKKLDNLSTEEFLKDKNSTSSNTGNFNARGRNRVSWGTYIQMFLVLVFILFLILIFYYLSKGRLRKTFVGNNGVEILARTSILPKQSILVLRVGPKLLIVNSHVSGAMNTLTEFTKPEDIEMILQEIEKPSNDNIFQTLLKRNEVLYDEELAHPEKELEKIEKKVDQVEDKFEV